MVKCGQATGKSRAKKEDWNLRLYVDGKSIRSLNAVRNLKKICDEFLAGRCRIEVIDLVQRPKLAALEKIIALPTLVRMLPGRSSVRVIGDLSNTPRVLALLDVH